MITLATLVPMPLVFLLGVAMGWHARPKVVQVHVHEGDPRVQARDNEIVTYVHAGREVAR